MEKYRSNNKSFVRKYSFGIHKSKNDNLSYEDVKGRLAVDMVRERRRMYAIEELGIDECEYEDNDLLWTTDCLYMVNEYLGDVDLFTEIYDVERYPSEKLKGGEFEVLGICEDFGLLFALKRMLKHKKEEIKASLIRSDDITYRVVSQLIESAFINNTYDTIDYCRIDSEIASRRAVKIIEDFHYDLFLEMVEDETVPNIYDHMSVLMFDMIEEKILKKMIESI